MKTVREGDELTRQTDGEKYRIVRIMNRVMLMRACNPKKQSLLVAGMECLDEFVAKHRTRHTVPLLRS